MVQGNSPDEPVGDSESVFTGLREWLDARMRFDATEDPAPDRPGRDPSALILEMEEAERTLALISNKWPNTWPIDSKSMPPEASAPMRESQASGIQHDVARVPDQLGRFKISGLLGRGGMGNVFLADDPVLQRRVALKVPHPEFVLVAELRKRFLREARAAGMTRHPNIVGVHESGEVDGVCYIAYEYCLGPTLADWQKESLDATDGVPIAPHVGASIVERLADGIAHAHERNVIHRDLKPSNILMESSENAEGLIPRITDFGLASIERDGTSSLTRSGGVIGSAEYMAPEQASGNRDQIGRATDVYALGVILYELLTNVSPFRRKTLQATLAATMHETPVALRRLRREIPADLEAITLKALEKDPKQRYASANDLRDDIVRFRAELPITARSTPIWTSLYRYARRNQMAATLIAVSLLALISAVLGLWIHGQTLKEHARSISEYSDKLSTALDEAKSSNLRSRNLVYIDDVQLAYKAWDEKLFSQAYEILGRQLPEAGETDLRRQEWYFLRNASRPPSVRVLGKHTGPCNELSLFPGRKRAVSVGEDGVAKVWDLETGDEVYSIQCSTRPLHSVAVSPDGETIATGSNALELWDAENGKHKKRAWLDENNIESLAYSPNGDRIALGTRYHHVRMLTGNGEKEIASIEDAHKHHVLSFTPDGNGLLMVGRETREKHFVRLWKTDLSAPIATYFVPGPNPSSPYGSHAICSPSGKYYMLGEEYSTVFSILDAKSGEPILQLNDYRKSNLYCGGFASKDSFFAVGYRDGTLRVWRFHGNSEVRSAELTASFKAHVGRVCSLAFTDEGVLTCGQDGIVKAWDLRSAGSVDFLPLSATRMGRFGSQLAVTDREGGMLVLNTGYDELPVAETSYHPDFVSTRLPSLRIASQQRDTYDAHSAFLVMPGIFGEMSEFENLASKSPKDGSSNSAMDGVVALSPEKPVVEVYRSSGGRPAQSHVFENVVTIDGLASSPVAFVVEYDGDLWELDLVTGVRRILNTVGHEDPVAISDISLNEQWFALARSGQINLIELSSGQILWQQSTDLNAASLCFSPDGARLAVGRQDGSIVIRNSNDGSVHRTLLCEDGYCSSVAFSPDGKLVASCSWSGTARLWDPETGRELGVILRTKRDLRGISFSESGKSLYVAGLDGIWTFQTGRQK